VGSVRRQRIAFEGPLCADFVDLVVALFRADLRF
jgi:hypothetical protein